MKWSEFWASVGILCVCLTPYTEECSPPGLPQSMEPSERAKKAQMVVFGTVVASPRVRNKQEFKIEDQYSATFRLHCIIKGPKLKSLVNITGFGDFNGGRCVHSTALLNKTYVVFVKNVPDTGELTVHEINVQRASLHVGQVHRPDNLAVLRDIMEVVGQNASLPLDANSNEERIGCRDFAARYPSKQRDPERKAGKNARPCRCRKKKYKHRKRKRLSKVKTLPSSKIRGHEQPTLARTRRYDVRTAAEHGNVDVLIQDMNPVRSCALRPRWGLCCLTLLTLHILVLTLITWQNT